MYHIGIDIGSTYAKYGVLNEKYEILCLFTEKTPILQQKYFHEKLIELNKQYNDATIISCGYGRRNIQAKKNINELVALAKGSDFLNPGVEVVLDVGGQDTKVICQANGQLKDFFINDKCAAGSGIFLSNVTKMLETDIDNIDLTDVKKPDIVLSSLCAVFAQSEIVDLLAANVPIEQIIYAVIWHIIMKSKPLLGKFKNKDILLSGGLTRIKGIREFTEHVLEVKCILPEHARYLSAIGAAIS